LPKGLILITKRLQVGADEVAPVVGDLVCSEWGFDQVSEFAGFDVVLFGEDLVTWTDFLSQCSGDAVWVGFVEEYPDVVAFFSGEFGQERNTELTDALLYFAEFGFVHGVDVDAKPFGGAVRRGVEADGLAALQVVCYDGVGYWFPDDSVAAVASYL